MPSKNKQPEIPLPKSRGTHVKSAILHVIALGQDPSSGQGSIPVKRIAGILFVFLACCAACPRRLMI